MSGWVRATLPLLLSLAAWGQEGGLVRTFGERKAWVRPCTEKNRPALIVLHASASSAGQIERLTGFSSLAQNEKLVVIYPEAADGGWNDGRPDAFPSHGPQDDVAFVDQCLNLAVAEYAADPRHLYVVGFDSGADLALLCGLRLNRLAGVASCMGGLSPALGAPSSVPLFCIASEADPCFPFNGGPIRYFGGRPRGQILASDELMRRWTGQLAPTAVDGFRENWGPRHQRIHLRTAGHLWPGTEAPVSEQMFGPLSRDYSATQGIWDFFKSQSETPITTSTLKTSPNLAVPNPANARLSLAAKTPPACSHQPVTGANSHTAAHPPVSVNRALEHTTPEAHQGLAFSTPVGPQVPAPTRHRLGTLKVCSVNPTSDPTRQGLSTPKIRRVNLSSHDTIPEALQGSAFSTPARSQSHGPTAASPQVTALTRGTCSTPRFCSVIPASRDGVPDGLQGSVFSTPASSEAPAPIRTGLSTLKICSVNPASHYTISKPLEASVFSNLVGPQAPAATRQGLSTLKICSVNPTSHDTISEPLGASVFSVPASPQVSAPTRQGLSTPKICSVNPTSHYTISKSLEASVFSNLVGPQAPAATRQGLSTPKICSVNPTSHYKIPDGLQGSVFPTPPSPQVPAKTRRGPSTPKLCRVNPTSHDTISEPPTTGVSQVRDQQMDGGS